MTKQQWTGLVLMSPMFFILGWTTLVMIEFLKNPMIQGVSFIVTAIVMFMAGKDMFRKEKSRTKNDAS